MKTRILAVLLFFLAFAGKALAQDTATQTFTLTVLAPLSISATLPQPVVGTAYSAPLAITGGVAPYTCALTTGTFPTGLALGTGVNTCTISGTPTVAGQSTTFTITVTDSAVPGSRTLRLDGGIREKGKSTAP